MSMFGKSATGDKLHAKQELNNPMDKFAVKVIKHNERVQQEVQMNTSRFNQLLKNYHS